MPANEIFRGSKRFCFAAVALFLSAPYITYKILSETGQDVWRSVIVALPRDVSTKNITSTSYYILKQTHEPVFRKEDGYNYSSRILKRWARSMDYRDFTFCPDTTLRFDASSRFSFDLFKRHITEITAKFDGSASISEAGACLNVRFMKPSRRYLDYLTAYSNAPSVSISSVAEAGLGPYLPTAVGKDEIILSRKRRVSQAFNTIYIYNYRGPDDVRLRGISIDDCNFVSTRKGMDFPEAKYVGFETMAPKAMVLLINLPAESDRKRVYNCIDIDGLRKAFSGKDGPFRNMRTILPVGVPGGIPGEPIQKCIFKKSELKAIGPVVLANWRNDRSGQLKEYAEALRSRSGLQLKVIDYKPAELAARMRGDGRPRGIVVMMTGADSDDNYRLLTSYFGKNNLLDFDIPGVERLYAELSREDSPEGQERIAATIADKIAKSWALLPLYQSITSVYYPRRVKNLHVGKEFLEYPEIGDFRW